LKSCIMISPALLFLFSIGFVIWGLLFHMNYKIYFYILCEE
jgi:hypothetical protein